MDSASTESCVILGSNQNPQPIKCSLKSLEMLMNKDIKEENEKKKCLFPQLPTTCGPHNFSVEGQKVLDEFKVAGEEVCWSSKRRKRSFSCPRLEIKKDCDGHLPLTDTRNTCQKDLKFIQITKNRNNSDLDSLQQKNMCKDLSALRNKCNCFIVRSGEVLKSRSELDKVKSRRENPCIEERAGGTGSFKGSALENFPTSYCLDTNLDYNETSRKNTDECRFRTKGEFSYSTDRKATVRPFSDREFNITSKNFDSRLEWLEAQPDELDLPSKAIMKKSVRKCQSWIRKHWDYL